MCTKKQNPLASSIAVTKAVRPVKVCLVGVVLIDRDDHLRVEPTEIADPARECAAADDALGREQTENVAMAERQLAIPDIEDAIAIQGAGNQIASLRANSLEPTVIAFRFDMVIVQKEPARPVYTEHSFVRWRAPLFREDSEDEPSAASWFGAAVSEQARMMPETMMAEAMRSF